MSYARSLHRMIDDAAVKRVLAKGITPHKPGTKPASQKGEQDAVSPDDGAS